MNRANAEPTKRVGSVFELPGKSIKIVKKNWKLFAVVNVLTIISTIFAIFDTNSYGDGGTGGSGAFDFSGIASGRDLGAALGVGLVLLIVILLIAVLLYAMSTSLEVRTSKGEKPNLKTVFEDGKKYFFRLIGLTVVSGLIVVVGLILLIIPGLYAIYRLIFAPYHMLDKNLGIVESLKASNNMAKGRGPAIWAAVLLFTGIAILSGVISAVPIIGPIIGTLLVIACSLILVLRYRELRSVGA